MRGRVEGEGRGVEGGGEGVLEEGFGGGVNCNQGTELRRSISDVCVCVCVCVRVCVQCLRGL